MRLASAMAATFSGFFPGMRPDRSSPGSERLRAEITPMAPRQGSRRTGRFPVLEMALRRSFPLLDCGLGVSPGQADRSRAEWKADTSGSVAAKTLAVMGPMAGIA